MMGEYFWCILIVSLIVGTTSEPILRFRLTEPGDVVLHKDNVRLVKGSDMRVKCETARPSGQQIANWTKLNDDTFTTQLASLNLYDLEKQDSGTYSCSIKEYKRRLSVNVLYPPEKAEIQTVERGSRHYLSCEADSNPPAKYLWKYSTSAEAKIVGKGSTMPLPDVQNNNTWLHCFVQNRMVQTVGPAIMSPVVNTAKRVVANQVPAHVVGLPSTYTTYSGFTIDITCDVKGVPSPTVWWSKESDAFNRSGNRLIEENVQESFAGIYMCNANNMVKENDNVHATKEINIEIIEQYQLWAIAASVSGWITTLSIAVLALLFIIRRKMKRESYQRMNEPSSMRLSEIIRNDHSCEQSSHSRKATNHEDREQTQTRQKENSWDSACQHCKGNNSNQQSAEETRKKTICDTESDTARLHFLL